MTRARLLALLLVCTPAKVRAEARARLSYVADGAGCPGERAFRDIVVARLGYDPFRADAELEVQTALVRDEAGLVGTLRLVDAQDRPAGARTLQGAASECWELASALATAVAVALDPLADATAPAPPAAQAAPEADEPPAPVAPPAAPAVPSAPSPAPVAPPGRPLRAVVRAGLGATFGLTPGPALSPELAVGLRVSSLSVLVQGRTELMPNAHQVDAGDRVEATVYALGPATCLHAGPALACLGLEFGAFQGRGVDVRDSRTQSSFFAAGSAQLGAGLALGRTVTLAALGELRVPFVRTSLAIDGRTVWNAPALGGGLRLAVLAQFP